MPNRPAPDLDLTDVLVHGLLETQHAAMAHLPLRMLERGFDNTLFRLGDNHLVRLPHREEAAELILNEQRWLGELAQMLELSIPAPTHIGLPDPTYPWHWSITPWFAGEVGAVSDSADTAPNADILGRFLSQLHVDAPADAPSNPHRGGPLSGRTLAFESNLEAVDANVDKAALAQVFTTASRAAPSTQNLWLHGDLHGRNMIFDEGRLSAVIDWGDICAGDPAVDLSAAFMVVPNHLDIVRALAGASPDDWTRARGWAAHFAVLYVLHGDDDEILANMGHRLIATLLES